MHGLIVGFTLGVNVLVNICFCFFLLFTTWVGFVCIAVMLLGDIFEIYVLNDTTVHKIDYTHGKWYTRSITVCMDTTKFWSTSKPTKGRSPAPKRKCRGSDKQNQVLNQKL